MFLQIFYVTCKVDEDLRLQVKVLSIKGKSNPTKEEEGEQKDNWKKETTKLL